LVGRRHSRCSRSSLAVWTIRLLGIHLTNSRAQTAPGSAHALDLARLNSPEICFWSAWDGDDLLAIGAMKRLPHSHGEVKSMHTAEVVRRRGVGSEMLENIIDAARNRGIRNQALKWDRGRIFNRPSRFTSVTDLSSARRSATTNLTRTAFL
jgi:GNAT superfamily N-acetyltransferase